MKLCKINFRYQQIVHSIHTTQQHKTGVVNIYLYGCVNLLAPVCCIFVCVCVCVSVCVILNQRVQVKNHTISPYHKPILPVTSKRERSSLLGKNLSSHFRKITPFQKMQNLNCRLACH